MAWYFQQHLINHPCPMTKNSSVKCTIGPVVNYKKFWEIIEKRVFFVSNLLHWGLHIMLLVVIDYYERDVDLPLIKIGKGSTTFLSQCLLHPYHSIRNGVWEQKRNTSQPTWHYCQHPAGGLLIWGYLSKQQHLHQLGNKTIISSVILLLTSTVASLMMSSSRHKLTVTTIISS